MVKRCLIEFCHELEKMAESKKLDGLIKRLHKIGVSDDEFIIAGSAAIKKNYPDFREIDDLDVIVSPPAFKRLAQSGKLIKWSGGTVKRGLRTSDDAIEMATRFRNIPFRSYMGGGRSSVVDGVRTISMPVALKWKIEAGRTKDISDAEFLKKKGVQPSK